jgi:hypothetical protein
LFPRSSVQSWQASFLLPKILFVSTLDLALALTSQLHKRQNPLSNTLSTALGGAGFFLSG